MKYLYRSPLGPITIRSDNGKITQVRFSALGDPGQMDDAIRLVCNYLDTYFSGDRPTIDGIVLQLNCTVFQKRILKYLLQIPYGATTTYGQIAQQYAQDYGIKKMSAQAVGQAVGANPIAILIPCHRVVGSGGKLTGYAGGLDKKLQLLKIEGKE